MALKFKYTQPEFAVHSTKKKTNHLRKSIKATMNMETGNTKKTMYIGQDTR